MNGYDIYGNKAWTEEERLAWVAEQERKNAERVAAEAAEIARKAAKRGMTVEAYKAETAAKAAEKAHKAKVARYTKELAEMKNRMAYLEKWLAENA